MTDSPNDAIRPGENANELLVFDHGFVRLDDAMATDLSVVNSARVSFAVRRDEMEERDKGLIKFLMRDRHGSPFEHNSFRFHIRTPIFVAREWFRHRIGCLTGDTQVTFVNNKGTVIFKTIEELWTRWQSGGAAKVRAARLRTLDEEGGRFGEGRITAVVDKGPQPVYSVVLADSKQIKATENHRFLTSDGWETLRGAVGLDGAGEQAEMTERCHLMVNGHATLVSGSLELSAHPVRVVSVEYLGIEQTYDLCVQGPWHNFVANGIVVHNSFNEESARYHKLSDDFYVPEPGAVRSQAGKPGAYYFEPAGEELADETRSTFTRIYKDLFEQYEALLEKGVAKELARAILPFGIYTQFYWTLNARSLMNFLSLRNAETAQYEIRVYAEAVERFFAEKMPLTHQCFVDFDRRSP
jgi:thymidylate synthase ThyX